MIMLIYLNYTLKVFMNLLLIILFFLIYEYLSDNLINLFIMVDFPTFVIPIK